MTVIEIVFMRSDGWLLPSHLHFDNPTRHFTLRHIHITSTKTCFSDLSRPRILNVHPHKNPPTDHHQSQPLFCFYNFRNGLSTIRNRSENPNTGWTNETTKTGNVKYENCKNLNFASLANNCKITKRGPTGQVLLQWVSSAGGRALGPQRLAEAGMKSVWWWHVTFGLSPLARSFHPHEPVLRPASLGWLRRVTWRELGASPRGVAPATTSASREITSLLASPSGKGYEINVHRLVYRQESRAKSRSALIRAQRPVFLFMKPRVASASADRAFSPVRHDFTSTLFAASDQRACGRIDQLQITRLSFRCAFLLNTDKKMNAPADWYSFSFTFMQIS